MSTFRIKSLDVMSVAKIGALLGLVFGIIEGIFMAAIIGTIGAFAKSVMPMAGAGAVVVFVMCVIIGVIGGFIGGAIWAFVYNIAAGVVGPIEADLEAVQ